MARHNDYPHESGTLMACPACEEHGKEALAKRAGIEVEDIGGNWFDGYTIDGMDADEWVEAVLEDDLCPPNCTCIYCIPGV